MLNLASLLWNPTTTPTSASTGSTNAKKSRGEVNVQKWTWIWFLIPLLLVMYDAAHEHYKTCLTRQNDLGTQRVDLSRQKVQTDALARSLARTNSSAPTVPNGERGWIGVSYAKLNSSRREAVGLPDQAGVYVKGVTADGPSYRAGLMTGDVITAVDGQSVVSPSEFKAMARALIAGQITVLDVIRGGERRYVYVAVDLR